MVYETLHWEERWFCVKRAREEETKKTEKPKKTEKTKEVATIQLYHIWYIFFTTIWHLVYFAPE